MSLTTNLKPNVLNVIIIAEVAIVGGVTGGVVTVVILTMAVVIFLMKRNEKQTGQGAACIRIEIMIV